MTVVVIERIPNTQAHIRHRQLSNRGPVGVLDHRVHDGLWVHDHVDAVEADPIEFVRFDDFEALVHQCRRIDGDLGAHRPCRMRERFVDGDRGQVGRSPATKRASTGSDNKPGDLIESAVGERFVRPQTLVKRTVFTIDGHNFGTRRVSHLLHDWASGNERFLIGKAKTFTKLERLEGHREAGKTNDAIDHNIGIVTRCGKRIVASFDRKGRAQLILQTCAVCGGSERNCVAVELLSLRSEQFRRSAPSPQGDYLVRGLAPGFGGLTVCNRNDVECLGPNRTSRTHHGHTHCHRGDSISFSGRSSGRTPITAVTPFRARSAG